MSVACQNIAAKPRAVVAKVEPISDEGGEEVREMEERVSGPALSHRRSNRALPELLSAELTWSRGVVVRLKSNLLLELAASPRTAHGWVLFVKR